MWNTLLSGIDQGLFWAVLAIGVYISFRLLDFADLTCEGSFAMGGMLGAVLITKSAADPIVACLAALAAGAAAGFVTGFLNTKLGIAPILAGIITLTALTSVNLLISSSTASIGLTGQKLFYGWISLPKAYAQLVSGLMLLVILIGALYWFFGTEIGSSIRATGMNPNMSRASGINTSATKIGGLMLSNALIALSGALVAQRDGNATLTMGAGAIVIGLASVIIGETLISSKRNFALALTGVVVGSVIYRIIYVVVIAAGLGTEYVKMITAVIVVIALCLPRIKTAAAAFAKKTDAKLSAKYPKYREFSEKRVAASQERKRKKCALAEKRLADMRAKAEAADSGKISAKLLNALYTYKREKYVEKYGSRAAEELEAAEDKEGEDVRA